MAPKERYEFESFSLTEVLIWSVSVIAHSAKARVFCHALPHVEYRTTTNRSLTRRSCEIGESTGSGISLLWFSLPGYDKHNTVISVLRNIAVFTHWGALGHKCSVVYV